MAAAAAAVSTATSSFLQALLSSFAPSKAKNRKYRPIPAKKRLLGGGGASDDDDRDYVMSCPTFDTAKTATSTSTSMPHPGTAGGSVSSSCSSSFCERDQLPVGSGGGCRNKGSLRSKHLRRRRTGRSVEEVAASGCVQKNRLELSTALGAMENCDGGQSTASTNTTISTVSNSVPFRGGGSSAVESRQPQTETAAAWQAQQDRDDSSFVRRPVAEVDARIGNGSRDDDDDDESVSSFMSTAGGAGDDGAALAFDVRRPARRRRAGPLPAHFSFDDCDSNASVCHDDETVSRRLFCSGRPRGDGSRTQQSNGSRTQQKKSPYLIPVEHPLKLLWDFLTVVLSFVNSYATHMAIRDRQFASPLIRFCEVWFVVDILLNFVTEKRVNGRILNTFQSVWARYLTSWFVVDVISLVPFEMAYVQPLIEQQNRRNIFKKTFFRSKAVVRVTRALRERHYRLFGQVARGTGLGGKGLFRLLIKYVPKYLLFWRNMKAAVAVRLLRHFHAIRRAWRNANWGIGAGAASAAVGDLPAEGGSLTNDGVFDNNRGDDSLKFIETYVYTAPVSSSFHTTYYKGSCGDDRNVRPTNDNDWEYFDDDDESYAAGPY